MKTRKTRASKKFRKITKNNRKPREAGPMNICARCERHFQSRAALKMHSKAHLQALHELKMLEEGQQPQETKLGSEFRGKNRIIVS